MFYKLVIYGIFFICEYSAVTTMEPVDIVKIFLPITNIGTGFTSTYLVFFLCIPFLNILVNNMKQKQHFYLLLLLGFTYVLMGSVPALFSVTMNYVSWYVVLYLLASYIRLYPTKLFDSAKFWGIIMLLSVTLSAVTVIIGAYKSEITGKYLVFDNVTDSNAFLALLNGFSAFMFFKNIKIKHNPFINTVASTCFGVLMIHTNSAAMRQWLWKDALNNVGVYNKIWMPLHAILSVVGIFFICAGIDLIRIHLIEKPFFRFWDNHYCKVINWYKKAEDCFFKKLKIQNTD